MARTKREAVRRLPRLRVIKGGSKPKAPSSRSTRLSPRDSEKHLEYARNVMQAEARAILRVGERLGQPFIEVLRLVSHCPGHVVVTGIRYLGVDGHSFFLLASGGSGAR